jgi:hypothetical protein
LYRNCLRWRNTWVQICTETAYVGGTPEFWLNYSFFVLTIFCSLCLSALRHQHFIRIGDKNKQCRYSIQGYYFYRHTRGLFVLLEIKLLGSLKTMTILSVNSLFSNEDYIIDSSIHEHHKIIRRLYLHCSFCESAHAFNYFFRNVGKYWN